MEHSVNIIPVEDWAEHIAKRKPRRHAIENILPSKKGEYIAIAGRIGIGKTNLALHIAFCLATRTPFFGLECRRYKVAFLEFEGDEPNIMDRYEKIKRNFPPTKGRLFFGMMPISNPKQLWDEIWENTEDCSIIILDPVKYLVTGDYLKPQDAQDFVQNFRQMLSDNKKAAIISLPIRKPNEKSRIQPGDVYQMKGATEYADSATSVLLLEKKSYSREDEDKVTLSFAKHRISSRELKPIDLKLNRNRCMFDIVEGSLIDDGMSYQIPEKLKP